MRKAYKFRLSLNKQQEEKLFWTLNRFQELYNAALSERKDAYRMAGKSISYYEQKRDLPEIKEIRPEYNDIHSQVLQDVLLRLKRAFDRFFERVKNGEKPGYPRFQGRHRYDSFTYPQSGFSLEEKHITLSKIGTLRVKVHRKVEGTIKTCTMKVRRVSGRKRARQNVAGIVGISHVHLAYPCQLAEISKERGECSMLGGRQRRRELPTL